MILRWLKRIILGVLLLVLASLASISALVATEGGSRWVIRKVAQWLPEQVGTLEVGELKGNLLTGLDVTFFDFKQRRDGQLHQRYRAKDVSFRWQPLALLYSAVSVQSLEAKDINIILPPPTDAPRAEPFEWPSFALPVRIELGDVQLRDIYIQRGQQPLIYLQSISGSLSLGTFNFRMNEFAVITPGYGAEVSGRIGLRFPYAANVNATWYYDLPARAAVDEDPVRFSGAGDVRGDIQELAIEHQLATPFVVASEGTFHPNLVTEDDQPRQSPQLILQNEWQDQTLLARWFPANLAPPISSATLDVSGWYDNYHARLKGEVAQEAWGDFAVQADVRGDLKQVAITDLTLQQINLDDNALAPQAATLSTSGAVTWLPAVSWDLAVEAEQLNPAHYMPEWPGNLRLALKTTGGYAAAADQAEKNLAVRVTELALNGQLRGLEATGLGDVGYDGQRWFSDQLRLTLGANQIHVSGSYSDQIDLQWQLNAPLLTQIDPRITGTLSTTGRLQGNLTEPRVEATAQGKDLQWQGYAVDEVDLQLERTGAGNYALALTAQDLHINQQEIEQLQLKGSGDLARHQLQADLDSEALGRLTFVLQSQYSDGQWRGKFDSLEIDTEQLPRWWLTGSEWMQVDAQQARIGTQCLTTRVRWGNANRGEDGGGEAVANDNQAGGEIPAADDPFIETPQLCLQGQWQAQSGVQLQASLFAAPLRQARPWLKPDVTLGGVVDGELNFRLDTTRPNKTSAFTGMTAALTLQTRDGELRYQFADEEPNIYAWNRAQLTADLKDDKLDGLFVMDWANYGDVRATTQIDFGQDNITGEITANFTNLAPLEALIPLTDDVQGRLAADVQVSGKLQQPDVIGQLNLVDGAAKVPRLGVELTAVTARLQSQRGGNIALQASATSGPGQLRVTGDLNNLGSEDWQLQGNVTGENFQVLQQQQLKANISPRIDLSASGEAIRIQGATRIPYARAEIKALPANATRVSRDVVIIDDENGDETVVAGIPVFINLDLEIGNDVRFNGFGLDSKLVGKINILQSPPRALLTTGYVSVVDGIYKAYGQELEIERGRLLFQGPYDNPGLDILAVRETPEYTVELQIDGTLQQPNSQIRDREGDLNDSQAMAILLTGKPLSEASAADAYMLLSAVSGLGMSSGPGIQEEIARTLHVDELTIRSDEGLEQSSLSVGKYLSPRLFVRYVVGLFDQAFSVEMEYQMTDRLRLEATSGEAQSIDMVYKIER
ncbi:translocation/assembly module TamB domain-containing protein [Cellvibrio sp. ARAG 10.3]|uniref:translocation/assembly module TamB domain-containing protein n=1 Tax=Cellvibrio sp. ARAG 10.3 TaxID=3451358 RepID=UPI003F47EC44